MTEMTSRGIGFISTLLLLIALFLLMAAAPLAGQTQETRLAGRLPETARNQIDALLNAARAGGLPTEPLVDRALEGAAKGAPAALIVTAVTRLRDELLTTRVAFGETASATELAAGASALRAGATADDLARLRALRRGRPLTVASAVLADLVAAGVPADTAVGAVLALASDTEDTDYIAFRRNVQRDVALGASPSAALGVRLQGIADAVPTVQSGVPGTGGQGESSPRKRKP